MMKASITLPDIDPGKYDLTVQADGFKTSTRDGLVLQVEQRAMFDVQLQVGGADQQVIVKVDDTPCARHC